MITATEIVPSWLMFLPQLPAKPAYARVKTWRRLADIGAVAVKNAVHVLPNTQQAREDFEWLLREVIASGGEGLICEARLLDGLSDAEVRDIFNAARDQEYDTLSGEIREAMNQLELRKALTAEDRIDLAARLKRWRRRLTDLAAVDFFDAPSRHAADALLIRMEAHVTEPNTTMAAPTVSLDALHGRIWVTRQGIKVDRIACAWLIRRFIDPEARFKFVPGQGYAPGPDEVRFDMFEAEFTHEGDRCSFEVLTARAGLADPALRPIAEIVHDVDLKDGKFGRPEAPGIASVIDGIAAASAEDEHRLARGASLFDDLYANFQRAHN